jgi:ATP-dependent protease ClpP protease subunit
MTNEMPKERYLVFHGPINPPATTNLRVALCEMLNQAATKVVLLFSSWGGSLDDAVSLHTYIKSLPYTVVVHATGLVGSSAIPVFLASNHRRASPNARFFFHDYHWTYATHNTQQPSAVIGGDHMQLQSYAAWTLELLKSETKLADSEIEKLRLLKEPHLMSAPAAAKAGMVELVAEPAIPVASQPRVVIW